MKLGSLDASRLSSQLRSSETGPDHRISCSDLLVRNDGWFPGTCPRSHRALVRGGVHRRDTQRREPLSACWDVPFERVKQSRSFPSFKGQKNFPGLWWSATTGKHVGYESWVERDVAMLLDFDPEIVGLSAQPLRSRQPDPPRQRKARPRSPSHLWRWRGGGLGLLLRDPPADSRVDPLADATVIAHVEMHHVAVGRTPAEAYSFDEFLLEVHETGLA